MPFYAAVPITITLEDMITPKDIVTPNIEDGLVNRVIEVVGAHSFINAMALLKDRGHDRAVLVREEEFLVAQNMLSSFMQSALREGFITLLEDVASYEASFSDNLKPAPIALPDFDPHEPV